MDADQLYQLIMGQMNNNQAGNDYTATASANINNATNKNVKGLQSKFATTGLGRSGIGGAAINDAYATGNEGLSQAAAQGEQINQQNRSDMLNKLLGLYQFDQSQPNLGNTLLGIGSNIAGFAGGKGLTKLLGA